MLGKLASLKIVADNISTRSGLSSSSSSDPTFEALLGRSRCLRADAAALSDAAAAYASAAQSLGRAAGALGGVVGEGAGCDALETQAELERVRDVADGLARSGELFSSLARRRIDVGLAGVGEDVFTALARRRSGVDAQWARLARAERKGGSVGEGRVLVEKLREEGRVAMGSYVAERQEVHRKLEEVEAVGGRAIGEGLKDLSEGVQRVLGGEAATRGEVSEGVDWVLLGDELRLAGMLKFPDDAIVKLLPACWDVAPVVLSNSQLRCMTFVAPDDGEIESPPLHFASEPVVRRKDMHCVQYVIVKGTNFRNIKHVMLDLSTGLARDGSIGCLLHRGFYEAGVDLHAHLIKKLDPSLPVHIVGHSLGGAAGAVAALLLRRDGYTVSSLHLFGTPRFTDADGASLFSRTFGSALLRVAHYDDPIRGLPPPGRAGYRHAGRTVLLQPDDTTWVLEESPVVEPLRGVSTTSSRGLNVHRTSQYALAVARVLARRLGAPGDVTAMVVEAADKEFEAMQSIVHMDGGATYVEGGVTGDVGESFHILAVDGGDGNSQSTGSLPAVNGNAQSYTTL